MNPVDAEALALRIAQTWRAGPTQAVWLDVLAELDQPRAEVAYRQLRNSADHAPSIAAFLAAYRALHTERHDLDGVHCDRCGGSGEVTVYEQHGAYTYSAVGPCNCAAGVQRAPVLAGIVRHNDLELDRTNPNRDRSFRRVATAPEPMRASTRLFDDEEQW